MSRKLVIMISFTLFSLNATAETVETERLAKITEDYAKCADVALGNFSSDREAQTAIKIFYKAMIANIKKIVSLETKSNREDSKLLIDIMGKDIFIGFLLKGFVDIDTEYKTNKQKLKEQYNFDWRRVNEELWSKQGCNAIYVSLNK